MTVPQDTICKAVLDGLAELVVVVDEGFHVRLVNAAAERALLAGARVQLGTDVADMLPGDYRRVPPTPPAPWRVERLPEGWALYRSALSPESERLEAVAQLASGVARGLGPPLTAISMAAEYMLRSADADAPFLNDLHMLLAQAEQIGRLTRSLVDLARPAEPVFAPVEFDAVVAEGFGSAERQLQRNGVAGVLELHAAGAVIEGDANQLQHVVINLVLHAQRAALARKAAEKRVTVHTRTTGSAVELRVADGGAGFSAGVLPQMLLPAFSRSDGFDFAMYQAAGITHRHGGTLHVQTEPGRGSVLLARFPLQGRASTD